MIRLRVVTALVVLAMTANSALSKEWVVGKVGAQQIVATVSDDWSVSAPSSPMPMAATARITRGAAPEVVVILTVMQPPAESALSNATPDVLERVVAASAAQASPQSVEGKLTAQPFSKGQVQGWYFSATDKAPPPGEFKYMSQGVGNFGPLAVTFTVLSHADPKGSADALLAILGSLTSQSAP